MATFKQSLKHVQIDKANSTMVLTVSIAAFVIVFAGFASKALVDQQSYQSRVIAAKEDTKQQLEQNLEAAEKLDSAYSMFVNTNENIIGGLVDGDGERDGDNARIILDALPSKYDFPALTSSLEKILTDQNVEIVGISGTDMELTRLGLAEESTRRGAASEPISEDTVARGPEEMPFGIEARGSYEQMQALINAFERSIRPFHVDSIIMSGEDDSLTVNMEAKTYYQPGRVFDVEHEVVR